MNGRGDVLRPYVASVHAYDVDLGAPGVHRGLPSTSATLVLPLGEPLEVGWADDPASRGSRWSTVSGLHTVPAGIHHGGHQRGIQLALTPAGVRALLGVPAAELAGRLVEVGEVAPWLAHLPEQLSEQPDAPSRMLLLRRALVTALARRGQPGPRAEVGRALAVLTRGARVAEAATEVGLSRRRLHTLVRDECGVGPKELHRIARFQQSRSVLASAARDGGPDLAAVAARTGYCDQAHLTREWTALAGCPPGRWLREEFPFLQDIEPVEPQGC